MKPSSCAVRSSVVLAWSASAIVAQVELLEPAAEQLIAPAVDEQGALSAPLFWLEDGADGMRCDALGHLYTTAGDGVRIYAAAGRQLATVHLPEVPANCAFGGPAFDQLFVTARTSLYRVQLKVAGAAIPPPGAVEPAATKK